MSLDLGQVGGWIAAVGAVVTGAWGWIQNNKKNVAQTEAAVAKADAAQSVSDAERNVYTLMNERLTTLESEVRTLRTELAGERAHSRALERQVFLLEDIMRKAGMEPPPFEGRL